MGVKNLWQLLEPVGRRISIEALQNKRLAVGELAPGWLALSGLRRCGFSPLLPRVPCAGRGLSATTTTQSPSSAQSCD